MYRRHFARAAGAVRVPHAINTMSMGVGPVACVAGMPSQARYFSIPNPFSSKKKEPEPPAPEPTPKEDLAALAQEEDDLPIYQEPETTFFEMIDSAWDTALSYLSPFGWVRGGVYAAHDMGLEWWAAITLSSMAVRTLFMPLQIMTTANGIRMALAQNELNLIKTQEQSALSSGSLTEKQKALIKNNYAAQEEALAKKYNYQKWKQYLGFAPVIPFGVVFYTIRSIVVEEEGLVNGGALWFKDLTVADPTGALSVVAFAFIATTTEMTMAQQMPNKSKYFFFIKWGQRLFSAFIMWCMSSNPAGVILGFVVSGAMGMVPPLFMRLRAFREYFKIPLIRPPPRSTINVEATGFRKYHRQFQVWLAGGALDNTAALGGGVGQIAHTSTKLRNIADLKLAGAAARPGMNAKPAAAAAKVTAKSA